MHRECRNEPLTSENGGEIKDQLPVHQLTMKGIAEKSLLLTIG